MNIQTPWFRAERLAGFLLIAGFLMSSTQNIEAQDRLRIATYNASLYGKSAGQLYARLEGGRDGQTQKIAAIVQTVRPDIVLLNEIDHDASGATARLLASRYFSIPQLGREAIEYPFVFSVPSNTGIDSGLDLNNNGSGGESSDAWGYGQYPGQYAMAVYSRYPIDLQGIRSFQNFLWKDLPKALRPIDPVSQQPYHRDAVWNTLRLSSKNHVDLPILVGDKRLHILASHPTPPVFDGAADRNGCRNHDEIRFWIDYLAGQASEHLVDDAGTAGGLPEGESFVILGDLNSDPLAGSSRRQAIAALLAHPRLLDPKPASQSDGNKLDTASFRGNRTMRVDYVLPSRTLQLKDTGVFWPRADEEDYELVTASDHRMVWIEVEIP